MTTKIIYATTNPGKLAEAQKMYGHHGFTIQGPRDLGLTISVDETGSSLEENALLKASAYAKLVDDDTIVIADDTGIEIDALHGEPGIHVRRWKGYDMEDEEIISYCLAQMQGIKRGQRGAQFRTVLAIMKKDTPIKYFAGVLRGEILETPKAERRIGMPFWPLFYLPELQMTLGEFHDESLDFQTKNPTHREKAVMTSLPYLATLMQ